MQFFKSKLQIILSSAITILAVAAIAGATTIGTNISTDGTLTVVGNVGIGTTTPQQPLEIVSGASSVLSIKSTSEAAFTNQLYLGTSGSGSYIGNKDVISAGYDAEYIFFYRRNPLAGTQTISYATRGEHDFYTDSTGINVNSTTGVIFSISGVNADPARTLKLISSRLLNYSAGTNTYNLFQIDPTINTSGGTNTIRGIYYNPTLTSTTGTRNIAFENTTGNVLFGTTSGNVGIGTTSPTSKLDISPGTISAATDYGLYVHGILDASSANVFGPIIDFTTAGSGAFRPAGLQVSLGAGYTGSGFTRGLIVNNITAGTNAFSHATYSGNMGALIIANGTGTDNIGVYSYASNGTSRNIGYYARSYDATAGSNIGFYSYISGASTYNIGGYFGFAGNTSLNRSGALIADNGGRTDPIFVGRDNSADVFVINDGGNVGIGTTTPAATLDIEGYMKLKINSSQPVACSANYAGSIAVASSYMTCICNGTTNSWINAASSTQACVW